MGVLTRLASPRVARYVGAQRINLASCNPARRTSWSSATLTDLDQPVITARPGSGSPRGRPRGRGSPRS